MAPIENRSFMPRRTASGVRRCFRDSRNWNKCSPKVQREETPNELDEGTISIRVCKRVCLDQIELQE